MVFKQVFLNVFELYKEKILIGRKISKVEQLFEEPICQAKLAGDQVEMEDLKMHCEIEKQLMMAAAQKTLVFYYNEAVIQLGFVAFFAVAFPFAPLFSFLTNLLEIKIKLQHMGTYGRRNVSEATNGIGNWMSIMSFISYFAIPCNALILIVCRFPNVPVGSSQDLDQIEFEEKSVLVQYLEKKDPETWTLRNIIILCIFLEHFIIGLKIIIALIIPDIPFKV